jgi:hypothetical protein
VIFNSLASLASTYSRWLEGREKEALRLIAGSFVSFGRCDEIRGLRNVEASLSPVSLIAAIARAPKCRTRRAVQGAGASLGPRGSTWLSGSWSWRASLSASQPATGEVGQAGAAGRGGGLASLGALFFNYRKS